jgi:RNA polymerase sigma-70 factor (family 1)
MHDEGYNEQELVHAIYNGDERSFLLLFRKYAPLITPFIRNITYNEVDAEEIIQEVFIRIWLYRDKLPEIENLKNWIFTVTGNESMRYIRKRLTYEKNLAESNKSGTLHAVPTPEEYTQLAEINKAINEAVNAMPPQRKLIYQLSREQGLKPSEIATKLSLSVGTVKNVLSQSLKDIREHLINSGIPLNMVFFIIYLLF